MLSLPRSAQWIVMAGCCLLVNAQAEITTDGTVGPAQTLNGPAFVITENLGSRMGDNLFHSFARFDINTGEQATFTGSSTIKNVISRVTGGQASQIDGVLQSSIGQADVYFLNPAGVMFGANAQIDVPGGFYVSTADQLKFADGAVFNASDVTASSLSFAQPESFGFLGDQTAKIELTGSTLTLQPATLLAVSAADIEMDQSILTVQQGDIQLLAVGSEHINAALDGELDTKATGNLNVMQSRVNVSENGAGRIYIRAGNVTAEGSRFFADNLGTLMPAAGFGIDVVAESMFLDNGWMTADVFSSGLQGADVNISISGDMKLVNGSLISSTTFTDGNAGNVNVQARNLTIDEQGSGRLTAIVDDVEKNARGNAGTVTVNVEEALSLLGGGTIRSNTFHEGDAGNVVVTTGSLLIDGDNQFFPSTISSDSFRASGDAGRVKVTVRNDAVLIENGEISSFTGVGGGDAGDVEVSIGGTLTLGDSSRIFTDSFDSGDAGNVDVTAQKIIIDDQTNRFFTGITSSSRAANGSSSHSSGQTGSVTINTSELFLFNHSGISITSTSTLDAVALAALTPTSITINAHNITLVDSSISSQSFGNIPAGNINLNVTGHLSLDPSFITTAAHNADGGSISIHAATIDLQDSQMTTSVSGLGNGGDIDLHTDVLVLDSGFIQANTAGLNVSGGDITINAGALISSGNVLLSEGDTPIDFQFGRNVIQAAAPDGVSGSVSIASPQLDISGDLSGIEGELAQAADVAKNPCLQSFDKQSSLVSLGQGGLPGTASDQGTPLMTAQRLRTYLNSQALAVVDNSSAQDVGSYFKSGQTGCL